MSHETRPSHSIILATDLRYNFDIKEPNKP